MKNLGILNKIKNWIPSIIMMAVIFIFSSIPGQFIDSAGLGKESYHIQGHFILFTLLCLAYYKATKNIFTSFFLTLGYAFLDEAHQNFTPFRSMSIFDIYVDAFGASIAGVILWKLQPILPKKLKNWLNK